MAESAAPMVGAEVQGKSLTQRPEPYHRTTHIFRAHSIHALNHFSPVIFDWIKLLSAPGTSRAPSFPNENYSKLFRSQNQKTSQHWVCAGDHTPETGSTRRHSGVWKLVLEYPNENL